MAAILSRLIVTALGYYRMDFPKNVVLVPVPLYPSRERVRGFNQSDLIAVGFGQRLNLPVDTSAIQKIRKTKPQMELRREERIRNLEGAFALKNPDFIRGKTVILVDDVCTTGTTLEEIATLLRHSGARRVWAIAAAR